MTRHLRNPKLETRSSRLALPVAREPYWQKIAPGAFVGYRRIKGEAGSWWLRRLVLGTTRYEKQAFAKADDFDEANNRAILTFFSAQEKAKRLAKVAGGSATVREAAEAYLADQAERGKRSVPETRSRINATVLPALGDLRLDRLSAKTLKDWLVELAKQPPRRRTKAGSAKQAVGPKPKSIDEIRRRRNSANRTWNTLHALLEFAHREGLVAHPEWRKVRRLEQADAPRIRHLDEPAARRLTQEAKVLDERFGDLVAAALLTGCRFGELAAATAGDYADGRLYIRPAKTGKPRHVTLSSEGAQFFSGLAAGKQPHDTLLKKSDGEHWGKNDYQRSMARASKAAKIAPAVEFHTLRHTFASLLLARGVPIELISKQLGHSNIHVTLRHYAHLADTQIREIMDAKAPKLDITAGRGVVGILAKRQEAV